MRGLHGVDIVNGGWGWHDVETHGRVSLQCKNPSQRANTPHTIPNNAKNHHNVQTIPHHPQQYKNNHNVHHQFAIGIKSIFKNRLHNKINVFNKSNS